MTDPFGKTMSASRSLYVDDLTIGTVSITQRYSTIPYSITIPQTQGLASTILVNDGLGNLTWAYPSVSPPITGVLPVVNGGTGVTLSTGSERVVLYRSPTFADDITVPTIKGGGIDGSLDITTGINTSAILNIQTANVLGLNAPAIYIGPTRYPSTTGTAGQYLRTGAPASGFATAAWATIPISETTGTLPTSRGGTGLTTVGANGTVLTSNGTSLQWETGQQLGIMRYKQTYFPYFYVIPPSGMQLWNAGTAFVPSIIDFRTLYPVAGAQLGIALTYAYGDTGFGIFRNEYAYPVIAEISYSVARYQPTIPIVETGVGAQYDAALAFFTVALNGGTAFYIEKNNNGDCLATTSSASGEFCNGSITMVLQPNDFFQLRGSTTSTIVGLLNVESEIFIKLTSYGPTTPPAVPSTPGSGTVTSVNINSPNSFFAVGGGPITTNGTLSIGLSGSALPPTVGGTGLVNVGSIGTVLTSNGTSLSWQTPAPPGSGTVTSVNTDTSGAPFLAITGGPITTTGTFSFGLTGAALPTSSGGTGSTAASTGTGGVVLRDAPTFTTGITTPSITGSGTGGDLGVTTAGNLFLGATGVTTVTSTDYLSIVSPKYLDIRGGFGGVGPTVNDIYLTSTRDIILTSPTTSISTVLRTPSIVGSGASGDLGITSARNLTALCTGISTTISDNYLFMGSKQYLDIRGGTDPVGTGPNDIFMSSTRNISISCTSSLILGGNTYPQVTGSNGQVLTTDGAGVISWQTPPGSGGGGGVSSVGMSVPSGGFLQVNASTSATVTTTGVFAITLGTLATANGGTGLATVGANGTVLTSNGTSLSWTAPGTGTVTSVGVNTASTSGFLLVNGGTSGTITTSGTASFTLGTLPTAKGGTGLSTVGTSGQVLSSNGSTLQWVTPAAPGTGTVTNVGFSSSNSFITASGGGITGVGTLSVGISGQLGTANGGTGSSAASTGTGGVVLRTSPTFTTKLSTPEVAGSGTSGDLDISSTRNIILTGGIGNGIFLNTGLYCRNKIIGDTGSDLIIENPNSFIFLNPSYSTRTQGIALHKETTIAQTFPGTAINDTTILGDNSLYVGSSTAGGTTRLYGPSGCYANGRRIDTPYKQYGGYYGDNGVNFPAVTDTTYKGPTSYGNTSLFSTGLSYNTSNGDWTNISASTLLVTATYSFNLTTAVGAGTAYYFVRLNGIMDTAQNLVSARDNSSATATFLVAPGNFFGFYVRHNGFPCDFEPGSNIAVTWAFT